MTGEKKKIIPILMAGGSGTRLWPLSRGKMPKQFLPLLGRYTMFQETLLRFQDDSTFLSPYILTHEKHKMLVQEQCAQLRIKPSMILMEPESKSTGIAIAVAATYAYQEACKESIILFAPSDHTIQNVSSYRHALNTGVGAAQNSYIVTFGINPSYPETGYGYIKLGHPLPNQEHAYNVESFFEKPDIEKATEFIKSGDFVWNGGMFMARADSLLTEIEHSSPDLFEAAFKIQSSLRKEGFFFFPDKKAFNAAPNISFDHAVMEKTRKAAVIPVNIGWSDVGSWLSLSKHRKEDEHGNSFEGNVVANKVKNSTVLGKERLIALQGIDNVIIVDTDDALLIANKENAQSLKELINKVADINANLLEENTIEKYPWGHDQVIKQDKGCKIKRLVVLPKMNTPYQSHKYRAEHWFILSGIAEVLIDGETHTVATGQSINIPLGSKYRLKNASDVDLHIIEVQTGSYFGKDDIERYTPPNEPAEKTS